MTWNGPSINTQNQQIYILKKRQEVNDYNGKVAFLSSNVP